MSVLTIMLPLAFVLAAGALIAFIRAARQGQFDDLDTPALRMLDDEETSGR
ncbi:MAG: cbb3-type cytochrome oxidase assembly protein CcoS [Phycisphaerae bacterium]|nr:cbb3-type cytochrome oxidase assembly protein CcoS [Phycisphaerae bacterium]MBN8596354.1 cbb3-type cytochrome oxidase assembly protein CcoS [Planctomycetota bacterium]